jgi:hypothetical protein
VLPDDVQEAYSTMIQAGDMFDLALELEDELSGVGVPPL